MDTEFVVALTLTASVICGPALQPSKPSLNQPVPYPGSVEYCDEHLLGAPGSGQLNWIGYHTSDPREKVVAHYLKLYGSGNHEKLKDEDIWRFKSDKLERVLSVSDPLNKPPGRNCKPVPATARTVVILSMLTRPD